MWTKTEAARDVWERYNQNLTRSDAPPESAHENDLRIWTMMKDNYD